MHINLKRTFDNRPTMMRSMEYVFQNLITNNVLHTNVVAAA